MGVESRYGLTFGYMEHGQRNLITDVPGVRVGQVTIHDGEVHTGVTVGRDIWLEKLVCTSIPRDRMDSISASSFSRGKR